MNLPDCSAGCLFGTSRKERKMSEEKILTGIDEVEAGFTAEPEISAVEQVEIDSFEAGWGKKKT